MTEIDKFRRELMVRKYAYSSVQTYVKQCEFLIASFGLKPDIEQVKEYLLTIKSQSHHKQVVATVRHWYIKINSYICIAIRSLSQTYNCPKNRCLNTFVLTDCLRFSRAYL